MEKLFIKTLLGYHKNIDKELKKFFDEKIKKTKDKLARETLRLSKEFSLRPGKRGRTILVNCGYFLAGGKDKKEILQTSIFIELIHNYLLIHDDIIDRDKLRRGKPTVHQYYGGNHFGESMAICVGDLVNALGYEILTNSKFPNNCKISALETLNRTIIRTGHGQMLDLWLRSREITEKDVFNIYQNKTAFYTLVAPLQIGAILAGAKQAFLNKIEKFALPLGVAFQIQDDLSDIKKDTKENQPTLFRLKGSLEYCQKIMEKLVKKAKRCLNSEKEFPQKEKQFILDLIDSVFKKI
ncbi:MAG: polyprenyl synthetase family protein [Patescibacteria group bacterium]